MHVRSLAWGLLVIVAPVHGRFDPARAALGPRSSRTASTSPAAPAIASPAPAPAPHPAPVATASRAPDSEPAPAPIPAGRVVTRGLCGDLLRPDLEGRYIARRDAVTTFVDGDDLLALVNRSAARALAPDYAPRDLVDLSTLRPATVDRCDPPGGQCLRRDAAHALRELLGAMRAAGHEGHVHSAFRAYASQCGVFDKWAHREHQGFCRAATQSALAGHSQHQLGTTLDLFTREWQREGPVFRPGFGCSPGGRWLAEHAWEHGFVLPYPLHPDQRASGSTCAAREGASAAVDPRTGYQYEPWHLRYIGAEAARAFHAAWVASEPGTPREITLDQWLRARRAAPTAAVPDGDLPVCDGCACGACTTLADGEPSAARPPCAGQGGALAVRGDGAPAGTPLAPVLREVRLRPARERDGQPSVLLEARVAMAPGTVTQTPVFANAGGPVFTLESDIAGLAPAGELAARAYPDLPGAWRLGVEPVTAPGGARVASRWPWRAALNASEVARAYNGANVYLPAQGNEEGWVAVRVAPGPLARGLRVALIRDGVAHGAVEVELPRQ